MSAGIKFNDFRQVLDQRNAVEHGSAPVHLLVDVEQEAAVPVQQRSVQIK